MAADSSDRRDFPKPAGADVPTADLSTTAKLRSVGAGVCRIN